MSDLVGVLSVLGQLASDMTLFALFVDQRPTFYDRLVSYHHARLVRSRLLHRRSRFADRMEMDARLKIGLVPLKTHNRPGQTGVCVPLCVRCVIIYVGAIGGGISSFVTSSRAPERTPPLILFSNLISWPLHPYTWCIWADRSLDNVLPLSACIRGWRCDWCSYSLAYRQSTSPLPWGDTTSMRYQQNLYSYLIELYYEDNELRQEVFSVVKYGVTWCEANLYGPRDPYRYQMRAAQSPSLQITLPELLLVCVAYSCDHLHRDKFEGVLTPSWSFAPCHREIRSICRVN